MAVCEAKETQDETLSVSEGIEQNGQGNLMELGRALNQLVMAKQGTNGQKKDAMAKVIGMLADSRDLLLELKRLQGIRNDEKYY